ncbi:MAG: TetR/AcrR family transcriptional regulator [Chloroflexi bacterium]|nr:TetR/AcrR family transcriptional regulator [Chloroflexota bacterium]
MDDIAREAGVSKGALYLEWQGKEQLFHALLTYEMKRLLADFQQRMEQDPQGGRIANLYRHALLALQANPLMRALYTRDSRVLGDFVRRQDSQRYTGRFLLAEEGVQQMQAAGLLRADLRPEVIAYLFSVIAVGFIYIGSILPDTAQIPLEDITTALADVIQRGLAGPGDDSAAGKQAMEKLGAFVRQQYDKEGEA